ncbi:MAG: hypothetical protein I8H75_01935 [Myxococcaceae bacterium]|nr:hypothetical protein [Myxococcaceae bacterium]MBH2006097.1 hypothetical protein [Myxococcaceae bacterium]
MFDLKAQLLKAGLVTESQIVRSQKKREPNKLKGLNKSEQYELIRVWVQRNRFDKGVGNEKFFFEKPDQSISWLTLDEHSIQLLNEGEAGLVAFMSNNGLAHAVLPRDIVEDIVEIFPDWLRLLK